MTHVAFPEAKSINRILNYKSNFRYRDFISLSCSSDGFQAAVHSALLTHTLRDMIKLDDPH